MSEKIKARVWIGEKMNKTLTVYNKLTKKHTQITLSRGQYLRFKIHKIVQVSDDPEEIFLSFSNFFTFNNTKPFFYFKRIMIVVVM